MNADDEVNGMKRTILEFINDLMLVFSAKSPVGKRLHADLSMMKFFFDRMDADKLMKHVVKEVLPHADQIERRDENFFLGNKAIFAGLPADRVAEISASWMKGYIDKENKDIIWQYFDTIIALAQTWKKR